MTSRKPKRHLRILVLALPETAGSVLYGLVDVLMSTGSLWQSLVREPVREPPLDVQSFPSGHDGLTSVPGWVLVLGFVQAATNAIAPRM